jgi:hypothetical protein
MFPYIITTCGHTVEKSIIDNIIKTAYKQCPICQKEFDEKSCKLNKRLQNTVRGISMKIPDILYVYNGLAKDNTDSINSIISELRNTIICPETKILFNESLHIISECDHILEKKLCDSLIENSIMNKKVDQMYVCPILKCGNQFNMDLVYFDKQLLEIVKIVNDVTMLLETAN